MEKHGHTTKDWRSKEYSAWARMKDRCSNPNFIEFHVYGGRGVSVCERWKKSFTAFFEDVGPAPSPEHSIDRIDNDGNYEPGNVRWATKHEQIWNQAKTTKVLFNGEIQAVTKLAREHGIKATTAVWRVKNGWPPELWFSPPSPTRYRGVPK
jgi:hypothetical protein